MSLSYMSFVVFIFIPSIPSLLRVFIINRCWILSNAFSAFIDIIMWSLFFSLCMWFITFIDFCILCQPYIPGTNPTLSQCMIFLLYCWICFDNILFRTLAYILIRDMILQFYSFIVSNSCFGIRIMLSLYNKLGCKFVLFCCYCWCFSTSLISCYEI